MGIAARGTLGAIAVVLVALAGGLRPDTFYTGDPGVKLIAARNAAANPTHPLEVPLPRIGLEPVPYVDPFFAVHGNHAHAITSELFPLVTAPFLSAFGMRGLYILPALGFLLAVGSSAALGLLLDSRRNAATIMLTALLGTPLVFYGLEFWEHAPAVGIAGLAAVLFVKAGQTEAERPARSSPMLRAVLSGALFGLAILLRPEAVWWLAAVVAAARMLPRPPSLRLTTGAGLASLAIIAAPFPYSLFHFDTLLTPHIAGNQALWAPGWMGRRVTVFGSWFATIGPATVWIVAPALLIALVPLPRGADRSGRTFLAWTAILAVALTILTAPNDGGGQWGPRYLLPAAIPVAILAADVLQMLWTSRRGIGVVAVVCAILIGVWVQRMAYQRLRGTKDTYGRILEFVKTAAPAGSYIVTDLWWLDQIAAAATDDRIFLFAVDQASSTEILDRLRSEQAAVTLVTSAEESANPQQWLEGTCYVVESQREIPERRLGATRIVHHCD